MPPSASSARQARQVLADRLRELRLDAGLTARELARRAGWDRTKVSKIEHATRPPSADAIRIWCQVTGADEQAADLVASLRAAEGMWIEWRRMERTGLRLAQEGVLPLYEQTRQFRAYSCWMLPGLIQTEGYTRAVLRAYQQRPACPMMSRRRWRSEWRGSGFCAVVAAWPLLSSRSLCFVRGSAGRR